MTKIPRRKGEMPPVPELKTCLAPMPGKMVGIFPDFLGTTYQGAQAFCNIKYLGMNHILPTPEALEVQEVLVKAGDEVAFQQPLFTYFAKAA